MRLSRDSQQKKSGFALEKKKLKKKEKKEISEENFCRPSVTLLLRGTQRQRRKTTREMSAVKKLIPLMDRVLVERAVAATKTSGGILLPETVGSKVRRMFYSSFARILLLLQSSFYEFRFWFIVCLSEKERERERSRLGGRSL